LTYIEEYYSKMCSGEIIVCKKIKKQYEKLVNDIHTPYKIQQLQFDGSYKEITFIFDENKANLPINFIETFCKQSKSPYCGQPLKLMLWQKAMLQAIYGFVNAETGLRRYKEILVEVARKNGKSTLLSGLAAYHLTFFKGIQVVTAANSKSQAGIIFEEAKNMIMQSPALAKRVTKRKTDLYVPNTFSTMQPLASDSSNLDGLNADLVLLDEIHEFTDTKLYDVIKQSQGTKLEPLLFMITTNGFVRDNFFDAKIQYAEDVLNGVADNYAFLSFLYELDNKGEKGLDEIKDFRNWVKPNPALGIYRSFTELSEEVQKGKDDITYRPTLYAKYFNLPQTQHGSWMTFDELNNTETFDINDFKGNYFLGGYDLSEVNDLTCATMLFMKKNDDKKYIHQMYFMPKNLVEQKEIDDKVPYSQWIEQGWIYPSGTSKIKSEDVFNWLKDTVQKYNLYPRQQGLDRWGANEFLSLMESARVKVELVIQGTKTFSSPMKNLKGDFIDKKIIYNNNPVLRWCLMNTVEERDKNGNVRPIKGKNKNKRIDGTLSLLDAYVILQNNYIEFTNLL